MSLVDEAYNRLRERLMDNRLAAGNLTPEPELALSLGMSRTPVREALIRLEGEGLVELIPRRGVRVLPVSPVDMREIYEIFAALEPEVAADLANARPNADQLAVLENATLDMERAIAKKDLDAWADADDRFHRYLLNLHGNRRLREFVTTLFAQAHRARMLTLRLRELPERSTEEHREILRCIASGDAEAARSSFRAHRARAASELLAILEKFGLTQF